MFQTRPNLLILDEPTNHMDIIGKEALEQMLREYEGTVLFVSHDRYFIRRIATGILEFEGGKATQYSGSYEEYLEQKAKLAGMPDRSGMTGGRKSQKPGAVKDNITSNTSAGEPGMVKNEPTLSDVFDKKTYYNPGKIRSRLQRQLEKYERLLSESEQKLSELQLQILDPALSSDYSKLMEIQNAIDAEEKNQESLLERMLETETDLEELDTVEE